MADTALVARVRQRLVAEPAARPEVVRDDCCGLVDDAVLAGAQRDVTTELSGAGPLEHLLATPGVTDVLVNGPDDVWLDCGQGLQRAAVRFAGEPAVRALAQRLAASAGRRLDDAAPFVDAVLPDGTRLHAVLPPLAPATTISLRVLSRRRFSLGDLVSAGAVPAEVADLLGAVVAARLSFLVSGGTGSGKTTLLGALLGRVPPTERVVVIEDARELVVAHPHVVRLSGRNANVEGAGAVGLRELVRQALRMRPDRIVVGEFRGAEMAELLLALNTGHEGGGATLHANSCADVPARLHALGALGGLDRLAVDSQVASGVRVLLHLERTARGRRLAEIAVLSRSPAGLGVGAAWSSSTGIGPAATDLAALLESRSVRAPGWLS